MFNGYETEELVEAHIKALLRELEDCTNAGRGDRADLVRDQLKKFGYKAAKPQDKAEKRGPGRPRKTEAEKTS